MSIIFANSPNKPVINKSSIASKMIVGFEEETKWIIRKLTSGPAEVDVISIVGMPGLGKTTLAYRVHNEKSVVGHFDVCAWCTVDQERQKIFNQVTGLKERVSDDDIDGDVADKLRRQLFGKRYLIVLDDLWDTATWDELTKPFPTEFQKGSRVILTSRKKEVALNGKCHSDPLDLRLLQPEASWELLEKRVFGEEHCPDELKDVVERIAKKCDGFPLVLNLIGGVISRKEKKEALWLEVLNNSSSFIFKDEEEVMKDEDIVISWLKDLWSDEELVEPTDLKSVEEVTEVYVDELIASSLVIVRGGSEQSCQIHDARKEKLFDLTNSIVLSSSSPSDLVLHRRTIICDEGIHSYDSSFFSPEKRNPCAKHLSLTIQCMTLPDTVRNEICIEMVAKVLPSSFSNLCNLETLEVASGRLNLINASQDFLFGRLRRYFPKIPNLQTLRFIMDCSAAEQIYFPSLDALNKLERVNADLLCSTGRHVHQFDFHLPSNVEEVELNSFNLTSDALSGIGRSLANLQKLELRGKHSGWKRMEHGTSHLPESQITPFPCSRNYIYDIVQS
ncbi:hypothetical protein CQW23_33106 [Capsicum baccatum]|uniref:NB-ARC domain-containing protein n=1 Tax=Capsicum baccatum TaxID=33114 RepID=A0A2G2V2W0_CAPBA|nr:hypothetical protein CQW23_33106 [Capsicum baccatum]